MNKEIKDLIKSINKDVIKIHKITNEFFMSNYCNEYHNDIFDRIDKECIYDIFIEIEHYLDHDLEDELERLGI